jgi:hypothetical protein
MLHEEFVDTFIISSTVGLPMVTEFKYNNLHFRIITLGYRFSYFHDIEVGVFSDFKRFSTRYLPKLLLYIH